MELGKLHSDTYRRGIKLGLFFILPAVLCFGLIIFADVGRLGMQMGLIGGIFYTVLAIIEFVFRKDGLYLYENGLALVHFNKKQVLMYADIRYFTIASTSFISFRKSPYIVIRLKNEKIIKGFFEMNQFSVNELSNKVIYLQS